MNGQIPPFPIPEGIPSAAEIQEQFCAAADAGDGIALFGLLRAGAVYDQPNAQGYTALMLAVRGGHEVPVSMLCDAGADLNRAGDPHGNTALIAAVAQGAGEIAALLLDEGADIDHGNAEGVTALMAAASLGREEMVDLLLGRGAAHDVRDRHRRTAAGHAAAQGHATLAARLGTPPPR